MARPVRYLSRSHLSPQLTARAIDHGLSSLRSFNSEMFQSMENLALSHRLNTCEMESQNMHGQLSELMITISVRSLVRSVRDKRSCWRYPESMYPPKG